MRLKPDTEKQVMDYIAENLPQVHDIFYEIDGEAGNITFYSREKIDFSNITEKKLDDIGEIIHSELHTSIALKDKIGFQCKLKDFDNVIDD